MIRRFFELTWDHLREFILQAWGFFINGIERCRQSIVGCFERHSACMVTCFGRIKSSKKLDRLIKFIMLLLALWMIGDQVFDALQTHTYFKYMFWKGNSTISSGTYGTQLKYCKEATLAECWDYIHITMPNETISDRIEFERKCGTWNKTTKTIALNCELRLNWGYFACSLACWLLPPLAFGSLLTYIKYKVN